MARSKFWPALKPGDLVDVVPPGFGAGTEGAAKYLQGLGLKARITADLLGDDPMCCNTDDSRFKPLQIAWFAKDSRAIRCIRRGYGALRILPALAKLTRAPRTKVFIGYSDATSLRYFLQKRWKWAT